MPRGARPGARARGGAGRRRGHRAQPGRPAAAPGLLPGPADGSTRSRAWSFSGRVVGRGRAGRRVGAWATRSWASSAAAPTPSRSPCTSASCCAVPDGVAAGRRRRHPRGVDHRLRRAGRPGRADARAAPRWSTPAPPAWAPPPSRSPRPSAPGSSSPRRPARSTALLDARRRRGRRLRHARTSSTRSSEFTGGRGVDVVLDVIGGDYVDRNIDALARRRPHRPGRGDGRRHGQVNVGQAAAEAGARSSARCCGPGRSRRRSPSPAVRRRDAAAVRRRRGCAR